MWKCLQFIGKPSRRSLAVDVEGTCYEWFKSQPFKHFLIFSPALVTLPAAHIWPPLPGSLFMTPAFSMMSR